MTAEQRLWVHVLDDAVQLASGRSLNPSHGDAPLAILRQRARRWLLSPDTAVGTFVWLCAHLGLAPSAVRGRLGRALPLTHHRVGRGPRVVKRRERAA